MASCLGKQSHVDIFTPTSLDEILYKLTAEYPNNRLPLLQFPLGISGTSQMILHIPTHGAKVSESLE